MINKFEAARRMFGEKNGYSTLEWQAVEHALALVETEEHLRKEEYLRYLRSAKWRKRWEAIMKRDRWRCRFCGRKAEQVYHLTYARIFNEAEYDLVAICDDCHKLLHKLDNH